VPGVDLANGGSFTFLGFEESLFARKIQATVILSGRVDIVRATSYLRIRHLGVLLFYDESTSL
jgi:hypothetical protein